MHDLTIKYENQEYNVPYNKDSGYYEIELDTPQNGGIYPIEITYNDLFENKYTDVLDLQVLTKQKVKLKQDKIFMWIFNHYNFKVRDIIELSDYEIVIDEEINANTIVNVLKKTNAISDDIVAIKKNNEVVYWGIISEIQNENGKCLYQYTLKYITNLFDRDIILNKENLIKEKGIEDFLENAILESFTNTGDTFINKDYIYVKVNSHTIKQTSVTNVNNNIYNFHTWLTNCTQNYDIMYEFDIVNINNKWCLQMTIENKKYKKELIDTTAQSITDYEEVFKTDVVSKVTVLTSTETLTLFLLSDRTTTTDMNDERRVEGKIETIHTEKFEDARQAALDKMKSNSYNHNISFKRYEKYYKIGTPVAIKTKDSLIYDTYISAVKITKSNFIEYTCGNIRIKFIDKLLKERRKS